MKKYFIIILSTAVLLSCATTKKNTYKSIPASIPDKKLNIVLYSFTFPKSMTNKSEKVKYLNTDIYADYVMNSFISNFNSKSDVLNIKPIADVITPKEFENYNYQSILGSDKVSSTSTFATNYILDEIYSLLSGKADAIMIVESSMSFWSQKARIKFRVVDMNKKIVWQDSVDGYSYHIIGDIAPTRKAFYRSAIMDAIDAQKRHQQELYKLIDTTLESTIVSLKNKAPYMFSTNEILFTQKTFSLTNENYAKRAGI